MKWLFNLLRTARPHLMGAVGVLAVCGLATTAVAWLQIRAQSTTIAAQKETIAANKTTIDGLSKAILAQIELRDLEQKSTLALQDQIAASQAEAMELAAKIQQLEATDAETRDFMARPIPDDLRRLLNNP